jgi:hypothetical protein
LIYPDLLRVFAQSQHVRIVEMRIGVPAFIDYCELGVFGSDLLRVFAQGPKVHRVIEKGTRMVDNRLIDLGMCRLLEPEERQIPDD